MTTPSRFSPLHLLVGLPMLALLTGAEGKCGSTPAEPPSPPSFTYCGEGGWVFLEPGDCAEVRDCSKGIGAPTLLDTQKYLELKAGADWVTLDIDRTGPAPHPHVFCAAPNAVPGAQAEVTVTVKDILSVQADDTLVLEDPGSELTTKVLVVLGPLVTLSKTNVEIAEGEPLQIQASLEWRDEGPHDSIPARWSITDEAGEPFSYTLGGTAILSTSLPAIDTTNYTLSMQQPLTAGRYLLIVQVTFPGTGVTKEASANVRVRSQLQVGAAATSFEVGPGAPGCPTAGSRIVFRGSASTQKTLAWTWGWLGQRRTATGWLDLTIEDPADTDAKTNVVKLSGLCVGDEVRALVVVTETTQGFGDWDWVTVVAQ